MITHNEAGAYIRSIPPKAPPQMIQAMVRLKAVSISILTGFGYIGPRSENFQVHSYRGQQVLSIFEGSHNSPTGHGHGHTTISTTNTNCKQIKGGGHKLADQHELLFFNDHSALFAVYDPEIHDLTDYGATSENQQWILDNKVVWEWSSLDHVDPAGTNLTLQSGNAGLGVNSSRVWHSFDVTRKATLI
jgi:hypothetical protein